MKRTIVGGILAGCAVLLAVVGCGAACKCCRATSAIPKDAPERVEIDGREYTLAASLWRDFQPVAPPDGHPLAAVLKVSPSDMMPLPADLAIDHVWVLNGDKQWSTGQDQLQGAQLERSAHGGPKWGPGIKVDVVVRLKQAKQTWLLRSAGVEIRRTD